MTRTASSASALQAAWNKLAPREQTLVSAAAAVVGLALLWWLLLAPALHTLRSASAQHAKLDAQLQHMQALASEAQQLQAQGFHRRCQQRRDVCRLVGHASPRVACIAKNRNPENNKGPVGPLVR